MNAQKMNTGFRGRIYLLIAVLSFSAVIFIAPVQASALPVKIKKGNISQLDDPYHTAIQHALYAEKAGTIKEIQMHLHHVLNCLEGKTGKDFDASFGNPCQGQGALETLKEGSANLIRTNNCIKLAEVGITLNDEKSTRLIAETVYTILSEGK